MFKSAKRLVVVSFIVIATPEILHAQGIGVIPDGVFLDATPVVSTDRRYVRVGLNAGFSAFNGFETFPVPAAVGGGGVVGFGAGVATGGLNNGGQGGLFGPGASVMTQQPVDYGVGVSPFAASFSRFLNDSPAETRAFPSRALRGKSRRMAKK